MQSRNTSPLTGGMMVIVMPGRKGSWFTNQDGSRVYEQKNTQQIINISEDVIRFWAHKPLRDELQPKRQADGTFKEVGRLVHSVEKRLKYWLNEHFESIVGGHQLNHLSCSWTFQHNKA